MSLKTIVDFSLRAWFGKITCSERKLTNFFSFYFVAVVIFLQEFFKVSLVVFGSLAQKNALTDILWVYVISMSEVHCLQEFWPYFNYGRNAYSHRPHASDRLVHTEIHKTRTVRVKIVQKICSSLKKSFEKHDYSDYSVRYFHILSLSSHGLLNSHTRFRMLVEWCILPGGSIPWQAVDIKRFISVSSLKLNIVKYLCEFDYHFKNEKELTDCDSS